MSALLPIAVVGSLAVASELVDPPARLGAQGSADRTRRLGGVLLLTAAATALAVWPRRTSSREGPMEDLEGLAPHGVAKDLAPNVPPVSEAGVVPLGRSQNGWPAHPDAAVVGLSTYAIPLQSGRPLSLRLRREVAPALVAMIQWWDQNVEPVNPSDTGSFSYRPIRGYTTLSNHASGTAVDINGSRHALGLRGTVSPSQAAAIRAKAASLGLRWGGTYRTRADEMHVEVSTLPPASAVASSEAAWQERYGRRVS